MALALYRKYRPRTFAEVIGQEHVTEPLSQALRSGRLHHAYLFSGPRGCGKTSSARILARSLNCEQGPTPEPCGVCASCRSLANDGAGSIDVIEIDAASHGGVDDARELREKAFFAPASSRYKIYVIDEAHMVSSAGFNALLKLVEEPPDYVKFIFATTEPEKVLGTIRSRTHHYPFRLIPPATLRPYLQQLTEAEGIPVEPAVFPLVVRAGGGSARDTLSVLDQLIAGAGPDGVSYARAVALLGVTDAALIDEMCDAIAAGDGAAAYTTIDRVAEAGHDARRFASDLLERFRDLIVLQQVPDAVAKGLIDGPADQLEAMSAQAARLGPATLSRCADIVHNGLVEMRGTTAPRLLLELITARVLLPGAEDSTGALLQRLERMERRFTLAGDGSARSGDEPAAVGVLPSPASVAGPVDGGPVDGGSGHEAGGGGRSAARAAAAAASRRAAPAVGPGRSAPPAGAERSAAPASESAQPAEPASTASAPAEAPSEALSGSRPAAASAAEPAVVSAAEPAVVSAAGPGLVSAAGPAVASAAEPGVVSAGQPAGASAVQPVGASAAQPSRVAADARAVGDEDEPPWDDEPVDAYPPEPAYQPEAAYPSGPADEPEPERPAAVPPARAAEPRHGATTAAAPAPARRAEPAGVLPDAPEEFGAAAVADVPGPLTVEAVRQVWPEIVAAIKRHPNGKVAGPMAAGANILALDGQTVVLSFSVATHAERIRQKSELVTNALYETLGGRWEIRCEVGGAPSRGPGVQAGGGRAAGRNEAPQTGGPAARATPPRATSAAQPAQVASPRAPQNRRPATEAPPAADDDWPEPARPGGRAEPAVAAPDSDDDEEWPEVRAIGGAETPTAGAGSAAGPAPGPGGSATARPSEGRAESGGAEPHRASASASADSRPPDHDGPGIGRPVGVGPSAGADGGLGHPGGGSGGAADRAGYGGAADRAGYGGSADRGGSGGTADRAGYGGSADRGGSGGTADRAGYGGSADREGRGGTAASGQLGGVPAAPGDGAAYPSAAGGTPGVARHTGLGASVAGDPGPGGSAPGAGHGGVSAAAAAGVGGGSGAAGVGGGSRAGGVAPAAGPGGVPAATGQVGAAGDGPAARKAGGRSASGDGGSTPTAGSAGATAAARAARNAGPSSGLAAARAAAAGARNAAARQAAKPAPAAAWADGSPTEEAPYDPEYDGAPSGGAASSYEGFDPGDEPLDEVIDEKTARESSEQQAMRLLQEALGAEKIGEV